MIPSYPKVYNFGHRVIRDLFIDDVLLQEKIDGSQISFGILDGELLVRSKGNHIILDAPEKMFAKGVESVLERKDLLREGYIYRGEYLQRPKHNVISYNRIPNGHIILYDVEATPSNYLKCDEIDEEATRIGLESVPTYEYGPVDLKGIRDFLDKESCLGGSKIEGVVAKSHTLFGRDGKALMGKYVSEQFKEVHQKKKYKTTNKDIIQSIKESYRTEARWQKAVQHLDEAGKLEHDPKDIGRLIKAVNQDVLEECTEEIKEALFKWAWKQISRGITAGLPEWYKEKLIKEQFGE